MSHFEVFAADLFSRAECANRLTLRALATPCGQYHYAGMIQTASDAERWLEAKGGTWTKIRTALGWEVIAWIGPFSRRDVVEDSNPEASIHKALVEAVNQLSVLALFAS